MLACKGGHQDTVATLVYYTCASIKMMKGEGFTLYTIMSFNATWFLVFCACI